MNHRGPSMLVLVGVLLGLVPACGPLPSCPNVELHPTGDSASSEAAACAESLSLGSETYEPWCEPVRADALGKIVGREAASDPAPDFIARAIRGISIVDALAIGRQPRPPSLGSGGRCGRWWFAPADRLEPGEAHLLSDRVAADPNTDLL
jgi:hypothetical protein